MKKYPAILFIMISLCATTTQATAKLDNPFGPSVIVFDPSMSDSQINNTVTQIYNAQRFNEFGDNRYAFLFMPGRYGNTNDVDIKVGYYTQVIGLGASPDDVTIKGAVRTQDAPPAGDPGAGPGALDNFWRGAENLAVIPTLGSIGYPNAVPKDQNVWAVSQAAPMRRMHILGSLRLFELGWSSGGFLANSQIDNQIISGSQQQWFTRNSSFNTWVNGNWNMVLLGSTGTLPAGTWPNPPFTAIDTTPIISEKPFLMFDISANQYVVLVPRLRQNAVGIDWSDLGTKLPLTDFYIAQPNTATAAAINAALVQRKHILFTPGVYHLEDSIRVTHSNTILLGLGFPSLVPNNGQPILLISDVGGVKVGGIILDAGSISSPTLLQVGELGSTRDHSLNPTFLYDIFCRVGGTTLPGKAASCVTINSNNVVGDYFWLWRADHGSNVGWTINTSDTGLIVNGANVSIYGLMVEHFQKYQTIWNGENGKMVFYQSEIPYDPPSQAAWMNQSAQGYASYKVAPTVSMHSAWGLGIYNYFRDSNNTYLDNAIEAPLSCRINFTHMVTVWLDGQTNSGILHIINNVGNPVSPANRLSNLNSWPLSSSHFKVCKR